MTKTSGRITLPSENNFLKETEELIARLGADAIRDSDGTKLDEETLSLPVKVYSTYFVARGHNEFAKEHMEECQQFYLMSKRVTAFSHHLEIPYMDGFFRKQVTPDFLHDPKKWWELIDRTTGEVISPERWRLSPDKFVKSSGEKAEASKENSKSSTEETKETGLPSYFLQDGETALLILEDATPFHEYTLSFLAFALWDPTEMYNHITNNWGDKPADIPFDIRKPYSNRFAKEELKRWLKAHPKTDVVRFTTFFYHFTLQFNNEEKEKFVDWFGYGGTVSVEALEAFEKEYGYRLRPEDLVDEGYFHSTFRTPTKAYLDYMDFIARFVAKEVKELVDLVHAAGKEAMMFLGDNWIGTEPYGKYFKEIGLDSVVGSVGGGATLRLIADIPGVRYTEGRFLPYFFPDTFYEGNDPVPEAMENWVSARRAIMRKPVDRIGYGGYLSLAYKFPKFIDYIAEVAEEFRDLYEKVQGTKPYAKLKVGIVNAWGKLRSWQAYMVAHALYYQKAYSYFGILEALSGMDIDVEFYSFDELLEGGVPKDVDVLINAGDAMTSWSGGEIWKEEKLLSLFRSFVYNGGGLIGVGEPSACFFQGKYFQLSDIFGVDKEMGFSLSTDKYFTTAKTEHFLLEDFPAESLNFGESQKSIYALEKETEILEYSDGSVHLSAHDYGKGRGIYIAGLPYNMENTRLLLRALLYSAHKEEEMRKWQCTNLSCELHAYPEKGIYAVVNNSKEKQSTDFYDGKGRKHSAELLPGAMHWYKLN